MVYPALRLITNLLSGVTLSNGYINIDDGCWRQLKSVGHGLAILVTNIHYMQNMAQIDVFTLWGLF